STLMFSNVLADLRRKAEWYDLPPTGRSTLRMRLSDGTSAQILYRMMRFCQTHSLKPIAMLLYRLNAAIGHVVIGRGAEFGPGFVIVHSFGIVINSSVKAGRNVVIENGVTIGDDKSKNRDL